MILHLRPQPCQIGEYVEVYFELNIDNIKATMSILNFKHHGPFLSTGFNCLTATEPLRGGSLLFTTKFPEIPGTHMIDLGKNERLNRPWRHPVVLNKGPLDWESSALTTRPLAYYGLLVALTTNLLLCIDFGQTRIFNLNQYTKLLSICGLQRSRRRPENLMRRIWKKDRRVIFGFNWGSNSSWRESYKIAGTQSFWAMTFH